MPSLKKGLWKRNAHGHAGYGVKRALCESNSSKAAKSEKILPTITQNRNRPPTSVGLSVQLDGNGAVSYAGGFIVQLMPDADESIMDSMEIAVNNGGIFGGEAKDILDGIFGNTIMRSSTSSIPRFNATVPENGWKRH